jgi:hypothetical protein
MKSKHRIIAISLVVLWTVACFVFFQFFYKYHLVHRLDLQLFLYSQEYLCSYFHHPAWLASLAGDFLTQFFYFEIGGSLLLVALLLTLGLLLYLAMGKVLSAWMQNEPKHKNVWFWLRVLLSLCVMTWEALRNWDIDYRLSSTIALIGGIALFFPFVYTPSRFRYIAGVALAVLSYWLFGYGIWVFLIFVLLYELGYRRYLSMLVCAIIAMTTPFALRQSYYLTVKQAFLMPTNTFWSQPDFMIEKLLKLDVLSASGQWNKVAVLTENDYQKSGLGAYFYNLSHGMRGDLPDKLLSQPQPGPLGLLLPLNPKMSPLAIWSSNEAWFQLGDMTMAEHSALLGMIFSADHRSARMVKRLAEINMVNGDTTAVMKYLGMLQKTWLYKSWADVRVPGRESPAVKAWLEKKRSFVAKTDTLRDAVNPAVSLRLLLDSNRDNTLAMDYLLCYDMLAKDIDGFLSDYNKYKLSGNEPAESVYAQALLIALAQRKTPAEEVKKYMIAPEFFSDFTNYTNLYEKNYLGRAYLVSQFAKTYWFYYHFATFK